MKILKAPGIEQLERDIHVNNIIERIKVRAAKIESYKTNLDEIKVVEQEVEIDGVPVILFHIEGTDKGVAIDRRDIDSGVMSRTEGYLALSDSFEA